jgi:hypothetical protein
MDELRATVDDPNDVAEEVHELLALLGERRSVNH